LSNNVYLLNCK